MGLSPAVAMGKKKTLDSAATSKKKKTESVATSMKKTPDQKLAELGAMESRDISPHAHATLHAMHRIRMHMQPCMQCNAHVFAVHSAIIRIIGRHGNC